MRRARAALHFSLDTPWNELPDEARSAVLYGIDPKKGRVVATGTPEEIAACPASRTGRYLRDHLRRRVA